MTVPEAHNPAECKEIFERLSEYIDGELTPEERLKLEEHICGCPSCLKFIESLKKTVDLCRELGAGRPAPPLPDEFKKSLLEICRQALKKDQ